MTARRAYADRPCVKCGTMLTGLKGAQQYCKPCASNCEVEGCKNVVRARGKCAYHSRDHKPVEAIKDRGGFCGVQGCDRKTKLKGYCQFHYDRVMFKGHPGDAKPRKTHPQGVPCSVKDCGRPAVGRGFCMMHHRRVATSGEPGGAFPIMSAQGEGSITETGYRKISVDGNLMFEHRYVMEQVLGRKLRKGENIHHLDGDRLNNEPENLELWITQQPSGQRLQDRVAAAIRILKENPEESALQGVKLMYLESQQSTDWLKEQGVEVFMKAAMGQGV